MLTHLQYRILRRIAPGEPGHMDGSAYAQRSKLTVLLGDTLLEELRGKRVIDFGCGSGTEAIEMAGYAADVLGIDVREDALSEARARAERAGVPCRFAATAHAPVDVIVSLDSFEHFGDPAAMLDVMYDLLVPGGRVIASFGPTWFHPYGGHMFSVFPWAHLLFSERALIRWRTDLRSDGATRFEEVEGGLNQMTIARFERLVADSRFTVDRIEAVPIRRLAPIHNRLTREFTTAVVRCVLRRSSDREPTTAARIGTGRRS